MSSMRELLFTYGTLTKGEPGNNLLNEFELLSYEKIRGYLYDTGLGFPAAVFDSNSDSYVWGELYKIPDDSQTNLSIIDKYEGLRDGLFNRSSILQDQQSIHFYQAGNKLLNKLVPENKIKCGSWLRYGSKALTDPINFSILFENSQGLYYRKKSNESDNNSIFLEGNVPILVSAPHSTTHIRDGNLKRYEIYTAAIGLILHANTNINTIYTNKLLELDPNYYDESIYKTEIQKVINDNNIKFLIDIHGTGEEREHDIYLGAGKNKEFLSNNPEIEPIIYRSAHKYGISIGSWDLFPAYKQLTVSRFASKKLGVTSLQIEINKRLRQPDKKRKEFVNLIQFLKYILKQVSRTLQ